MSLALRAGQRLEPGSPAPESSGLDEAGYRAWHRAPATLEGRNPLRPRRRLTDIHELLDDA